VSVNPVDNVDSCVLSDSFITNDSFICFNDFLDHNVIEIVNTSCSVGPVCNDISVSENSNENFEFNSIDNDLYKNFACEVNHANGLSIASLNVRSILPKIEQIKHLLQTIKFDILCINESWLDDNIGIHEYDIPGYNVISKHRNRHGGGIVVYIIETLMFVRRCDLETSTVECVWIQMSQDNGEKLLLCSIYRPPSANAAYFEMMLDMFERACLEDHIYDYHNR
jgi:hypothetical protein